MRWRAPRNGPRWPRTRRNERNGQHAPARAAGRHAAQRWPGRGGADHAQALAAEQPGSAAHWGLLGRILIALDRHEEALPAIERALQIDARDAGLWAQLVLVRQNRGQHAQAAEALQRLRELDPGRAELAYRSLVLPYEESR